jgi:hypothetical protein
MKRGSCASVHALVIDRLNLLGDPFIQNRVRVVGGVYPKGWELTDV